MNCPPEPPNRVTAGCEIMSLDLGQTGVGGTKEPRAVLETQAIERYLLPEKIPDTTWRACSGGFTWSLPHAEHGVDRSSFWRMACWKAAFAPSLPTCLRKRCRTSKVLPKC